MGAWNKKLRFQLFLHTVIFCVIPYKNLQVLSSAMIIPQLSKSSQNVTFAKDELDELKAKCRFGHLQKDGTCECRNADCTGFDLDPLCMRRDSGNHRTWPNPCYMIEHACNARKKRLHYWNGECSRTTDQPKEVAGEYCEGDDVSYCENDGLCKYHSTTRERRCMCKRGYYGSKCQHKVLSLSRRRRFNNAMRRLRIMRRRMLRFRTRRSVSDDISYTIPNQYPPT